MIEILKGIKCNSLLTNYTDSKQLSILYGIGWYNCLFSTKINPNICNNGITPNREYIPFNNISDIPSYCINHKHCNANRKNDKLDNRKNCLNSIIMMSNYFKENNLAQVGIITNTKIVELILNNNDTFNKIAPIINQKKNEGDAIMYIGMLADLKLYVNLNADDNDTFILMYANKALNNDAKQNPQFLTSYFEI